VTHYPFLLRRRPVHLQQPGTTRVSQVPDVSLHASHALWTPAGPPSTHPFLGALCVGFWPVNTIAACFIALSRLYHALGSAVFPTGYVVPCIRLKCFVRSCPHLLNDLPNNCNTRYGWMVSPYPAGTCTLQETPSSLGAHRGRTVSCPTAPAQIPACGFPAPGSSRILASAIRPRSVEAVSSVLLLFPGLLRYSLQ